MKDRSGVAARRAAPRLIPIGDDTWRVFDLLKKCQKLARSLEKDGFPEAGEDQLRSMERRVLELRKRFKELEQLLRTRDMDLPHADREIRRVESQLKAVQSEEDAAPLQRALEHAERHRANVLSVMMARNQYVVRLQELYHHVRRLHSQMMMMDSPAPSDSDELIEEIDALVHSVEAVEVVRREVQATITEGTRPRPRQTP